jgi:hypothetical protein
VTVGLVMTVDAVNGLLIDPLGNGSGGDVRLGISQGGLCFGNAASLGNLVVNGDLTADGVGDGSGGNISLQAISGTVKVNGNITANGAGTGSAGTIFISSAHWVWKLTVSPAVSRPMPVIWGVKAALLLWRIWAPAVFESELRPASL